MKITKYLILIFILQLSVLFLPTKAQDTDTTQQIQPNAIYYNPLLQKVFSSYKKQQINKREGLTDDYNNELESRPYGGLTDDGSGDSEEARPSGGLTDDNASNGFESRPSGGLSDSVLEGK